MAKSKDYYKGKRDAYFEIKKFILKQIEQYKNEEPEKNTPRQITKGGKLIAFNRLKTLLDVKIDTNIKKSNI